MHVEQFVMAYGVEQDRLRAILPEGFSSLRPVLRINAEIRDGKTGYLEFNTAVQKGDLRGWLNIGFWDDVPSRARERPSGSVRIFWRSNLPASASRAAARRKRTTRAASSCILRSGSSRRSGSRPVRSSATAASAGASRRRTHTASASAKRCPPSCPTCRPSIPKNPLPPETPPTSPARRCSERIWCSLNGDRRSYPLCEAFFIQTKKARPVAERALQHFPSPSSLRSDTSPKGRGKSAPR